MQDEELIALYQAREESAIAGTQSKYGSYCYTIANRILHNLEDSEECVSDTWFQTWNSIPPQIPTILSAYLGKITRNLAINRYRAKKTKKRGCGEMELVLEELTLAIPSSNEPYEVAELHELEAEIGRFTRTLSQKDCQLFVGRYWYALSIAEIGEKFGLQSSSIKTSLFRTRKKLKNHLEERGIFL